MLPYVLSLRFVFLHETMHISRDLIIFIVNAIFYFQQFTRRIQGVICSRLFCRKTYLRLLVIYSKMHFSSIQGDVSCVLDGTLFIL